MEFSRSQLHKTAAHYEGEFAGGVYRGRGKLQSATCSVKGKEFKDRLPHGEGTKTQREADCDFAAHFQNVVTLF
jgi:hypothetical protein